MMAQRLYTNRQWPDPIAVKLTHVLPALRPPVVITGEGTRGSGGTPATVRAELKDLGQAASVEVGFQFRRRKGVEELYTAAERWTETPLARRSAPGAYSLELSGLKPELAYEFRAMVKHPLLTVFGEERELGLQ